VKGIAYMEATREIPIEGEPADVTAIAAAYSGGTDG
jgi:hypothetical protein